jgi:phosphoglucomutase
VAVFELPVVYQRAEPGEVYETHRFPDSASGQAVLHLTDQELGAKLRARDEIYHELRAQFPELVDVSAAHAAVEVVRRSNGSVPTPDASRVLRYERRGRLLQAQGAVEQVITYAAHFAPVVSILGAP